MVNREVLGVYGVPVSCYSLLTLSPICSLTEPTFGLWRKDVVNREVLGVYGVPVS